MWLDWNLYKNTNFCQGIRDEIGAVLACCSLLLEGLRTCGGDGCSSSGRDPICCKFLYIISGMSSLRERGCLIFLGEEARKLDVNFVISVSEQENE